MVARAVAMAIAGAAATAVAADVQRGRTLYEQHCTSCHGRDGRPQLPGAPDLSQPMSLLRPDTSLLASIRGGRGPMPAYAGLLRDREILDIVSHLRRLRSLR